MKDPLTRYRALAYATGVFLLLLTAHVILQLHEYLTSDVAYADTIGIGTWVPHGDTWIPLVHGYLYLAYVVSAIDLWYRSRRGPAPLNTPRMVLVVFAGTIPLMSFVAERWVRRHWMPAGRPVPSQG